MNIHDEDDPEYVLQRPWWERHWLACVIVGALLLFGAWELTFGSDYTRDGGTADWRCCSDKACTTVISQHADAVRARDACGKLTDADGKTRYTSSNAFRITPTAPVTPPVEPPPPPTPTLALVYSQTANGTYANLAGATIAGSVSIRIGGDCATLPAGPWQFYLDAASVPVNTESQCPYSLIDDAALFDTKTLTNGSHKFEARGAQTVTATFTVTNVAPPPATGTATLTWVAPTVNTDGSALARCPAASDTGLCLAKYRICRGSSPTALSDCRDHNFPTATTGTWTGLASGTHYFAVKAVNGQGAESVLSNVGSKVVP